MKKYNLLFERYVKIEDEIWFSVDMYNGLYRYNLGNGTVERVADFPNEDMAQENLYRQVCLYQNSLIFIPHAAKTIPIYDMKKKFFRQIEIPYLNVKFNDDMKFHEGVVYQDALYVIGFKYPGIIKVDLKTYETKIVYVVSERLDDFNTIYFGTQIAVDKNLIYIPCCYQNSVLIYDMDCDKASQRKIGKNSNQYIRIMGNGRNLYLLTENSNHIVCWNIDNNICREIEVNFKQKYFDVKIYFIEKYIWILSLESNEICRIDITNDKVQYFDYEQKFMITYTADYQNELYFFDSKTDNWYHLDSEGIAAKLHFALEEPESCEEVWDRYDLGSVNLVERKVLPVNFLIYRILRKENSDIKKGTTEQSVGTEIWNKLRGEA